VIAAVIPPLAGPSGTLAYRPFLDPLPVDDFWLALMIPLVVAIALVYKAVKLDDYARLWRHTAVLALQIAGFMGLAAVVIWVIGRVV
jgi:hypothetical protein